ncbi:MAG TPA: antibiotic biosynthesis monooxygenase family protein [Candidatus Limnocylindria bacterium]|nr:antibiotic biosynthesis monooxygenase family protein [Candidatus Limnocylindria bacterium]
MKAHDTSTAITLIDSFVVSESSKAEFLKLYEQTAKAIRTMPGFVEGYMYELTDEGSRYNFMTTAVWKDQQAYETAEQSIRTAIEKTGVNPLEAVQNLTDEITRATYTRSPY